MDNLQTVLANVFQMNAAEITDDLTMDEVERWDSLTHMKLVVALEDGFDIELSADQIMTMKSVKMIKQMIFKRAAA